MEALEITNIAVARTAILDTEGRLLVLWRAGDDEYRRNEADIPGGCAEPGEDLRDAAARELREETGIDLAAVALHYVCEIVTNEIDGDRAKIITRTFFAACVSSPKVTTSHEHKKEVAWLPIAETEEIFTGSPSKQYFVRQLRKMRESGLLRAA